MKQDFRISQVSVVTV